MTPPPTGRRGDRRLHRADGRRQRERLLPCDPAQVQIAAQIATQIAIAIWPGVLVENLHQNPAQRPALGPWLGPTPCGLCARSHSWGLKYWGNITRQPGEDILTPQAPTAAGRNAILMRACSFCAENPECNTPPSPAAG